MANSKPIQWGEISKVVATVLGVLALIGFGIWLLVKSKKITTPKVKNLLLRFVPVETYTPDISSQVMTDGVISSDQVIIEEIQFKDKDGTTTNLLTSNANVNTDYKDGAFQLKVKVPEEACGVGGIMCNDAAATGGQKYIKGHSLTFDKMTETEDGDTKIYEARYNLNPNYEDTDTQNYIKVVFTVSPQQTEESYRSSRR